MIKQRVKRWDRSGQIKCSGLMIDDQSLYSGQDKGGRWSRFIVLQFSYPACRSRSLGNGGGLAVNSKNLAGVDTR